MDYDSNNTDSIRQQHVLSGFRSRIKIEQKKGITMNWWWCEKRLRNEDPKTRMKWTIWWTILSKYDLMQSAANHNPNWIYLRCRSINDENSSSKNDNTNNNNNKENTLNNAPILWLNDVFNSKTWFVLLLCCSLVVVLFFFYCDFVRFYRPVSVFLSFSSCFHYLDCLFYWNLSLSLSLTRS